MKKEMRVLCVFCVMLVAVFALACGPKPTSIEVDPPEATIHSLSDNLALAARALDDKGTAIPDAKITWTTSDPEVVDIDATGKITAKKSGTTSVTVAVGELKQQVPVSVEIYSSVQLDQGELKLGVGEKKPLKATIMNEANSPVAGKIEWKSENDAVAAVDPEGNVTGVTAGQAAIVATVGTVNAKTMVTVAVSGPAELKVDKAELALKKGKAEKVVASALDAEGKPFADAKIAWASDKPEVATVSPEGEIQGVGPGEANITATTGDKTAAVKVTVK